MMAPGRDAGGGNVRQDDWHARWRPCRRYDTRAIQRSSSDPAQYAEIWLRDSSEHLNPQAYAIAYAAYLADFTARGVTKLVRPRVT